MRSAKKKIRIVIYESVPMRTEGDIHLDRPLYELDGKGMFISAFEEALLKGEIDVAVHSAKDMDTTLAEGLAIAAVLPGKDRGRHVRRLPFPGQG